MEAVFHQYRVSPGFTHGGRINFVVYDVEQDHLPEFISKYYLFYTVI